MRYERTMSRGVARSVCLCCAVCAVMCDVLVSSWTQPSRGVDRVLTCSLLRCDGMEWERR